MSYTQSGKGPVAGGLWERWPALLSHQLSAIVIALLLALKTLKILTEVKLNVIITTLEAGVCVGGWRDERVPLVPVLARTQQNMY